MGTGFEGTKGPWKAAEAWHCVSGLEVLKTGQEVSMVRVHAASAAGDRSMLEIPAPWQQSKN